MGLDLQLSLDFPTSPWTVLFTEGSPTPVHDLPASGAPSGPGTHSSYMNSIHSSVVGETMIKISGVAVGTRLRNIPGGNLCNCALGTPRDKNNPKSVRKRQTKNQALGQSGSRRVNVFSPGSSRREFEFLIKRFVRIVVHLL